MKTTENIILVQKTMHNPFNRTAHKLIQINLHNNSPSSQIDQTHDGIWTFEQTT